MFKICAFFSPLPGRHPSPQNTGRRQTSFLPAKESRNAAADRTIPVIFMHRNF
jgi:hypothetical protein